MKKMVTRTLCLLVAVVAFLGFWQTAVADDQVTLTFWSWEASKLESEAIQNGISQYEAANPNVKVNYMVIPFGEYHTKLKTAMASGTAPDVFYLHPDYQRDFINNNLLLELTDIAGDYVDLSDMIPGSVERVGVVDESGKTHLYGVDICCVGPVLFYNKDLFDAVGVPYPPTKLEDQWTWDEFVANMQKLTKVENGKTVQYGTYNWEESFNLYVEQYLLRCNGAWWFNDDYTMAVDVDSEATKDTFMKIKSLRTEYGVAPDPTAVGLETTHSPTQMFLTGQVATLFIGSYALQEIAQSGINYGAGLGPKLAGENDFIASAALNSIWVDTQHQKEALELMGYLNSIEFALPIYQSGLWMPSRMSMYEPENLEKWFDRSIYPEGWEDFLDMFKNSNGRWVDKLHNIDVVYNAISEELEGYFYADADLDAALTSIQDRINDALEN